MTKYRNDDFGKFTLELSKINFYKYDIKNIEILLDYINGNADKSKALELKKEAFILKSKINYIKSVLDKMYWKDKEILQRYFIKGYSYKMTGRKFNMSERYISNRICVYMRSKYTYLIDIKKLN